MESRNLYTVTTIVRLKKGQGHTLKAGGAWTYDSEIDTITGKYENGDLTAVEGFDGHGLGHGFIGTDSKLTARILSRKKDTVIDQNFIGMRARNTWEYRKATVDTSSCRILSGEADFLPGTVIDKFSDVLVMEPPVLGIDRLRPVIVKMLEKVPAEDGITIRDVYEHSDTKVHLQEGMERYKGLIGEPFDTKVEILENGVHYLADVEDGQKTGFFLDQKYNHLVVQNLCRRIQPDKVLDCFTHTGSFALSAGLAGSEDVPGVDVSCLAVDQASENAAFDGIQDRMHFECADVFDLFPRLEQDGQKFDVVVLDPLVFTKPRNSIKNAIKGYREINLRGMKLVKDGGYLATCSCSHFMDPELFTKMIREAAGNVHKRLRQVEHRTRAGDHPILWAADESCYLKFYIFQVCDEK